MTPLFDGVGAALVTYFDGNGRIDADLTSRFAMSLVAGGCKAILLAGTAGESWRLSAQDRICLCRALAAQRPGVPVIVGTGDRVAQRAYDITAAVAAARAADALLVLSPTDVPAAQFYARIVELSQGIPVLAYHLPVLSPPGIGPTALGKLPVAGIKDSSGDADRLAIMLTTGERPVFVGSPNILSLAGPTGAAGALVALANTHLQACIDAWHGDHKAQRLLMSEHLASLQDFPNRLKPSPTM